MELLLGFVLLIYVGFAFTGTVVSTIALYMCLDEDDMKHAKIWGGCLILFSGSLLKVLFL